MAVALRDILVSPKQKTAVVTAVFFRSHFASLQVDSADH